MHLPEYCAPVLQLTHCWQNPFFHHFSHLLFLSVHSQLVPVGHLVPVPASVVLAVLDLIALASVYVDTQALFLQRGSALHTSCGVCPGFPFCPKYRRLPSALVKHATLVGALVLDTVLVLMALASVYVVTQAPFLHSGSALHTSWGVCPALPFCPKYRRLPSALVKHATLVGALVLADVAGPGAGPGAGPFLFLFFPSSTANVAPAAMAATTLAYPAARIHCLLERGSADSKSCMAFEYAAVRAAAPASSLAASAVFPDALSFAICASIAEFSLAIFKNALFLSAKILSCAGVSPPVAFCHIVACGFEASVGNLGGFCPPGLTTGGATFSGLTALSLSSARALAISEFARLIEILPSFTAAYTSFSIAMRLGVAPLCLALACRSVASFLRSVTCAGDALASSSGVCLGGGMRTPPGSFFARSTKSARAFSSSGVSFLFGPAGGVFVPAGGVFVPAGGVFVPAGGVFVPAGGVFVPAGGVFVPAGGVFVPAGGVFVPAGGVFVPAFRAASASASAARLATLT